MAIYNGNYLSGRVGNAVHYERGGVQMVRARPGKYKDRKTEGQLSARGKFRSAVEFYGRMNQTFIKPIWQSATAGTRLCGLNLFTGMCMYAFGREGEIVDYEKLHLSTGRLLLPSGMEQERVGAREIRLRWSPMLLSGRESPTDELQAVLVCEDDPRWSWPMPFLNATRGDGGACIRLPDEIRGRVHLYCFFKSRGRPEYSDDWWFAFPGKGGGNNLEMGECGNLKMGGGNNLEM